MCREQQRKAIKQEDTGGSSGIKVAIKQEDTGGSSGIKVAVKQENNGGSSSSNAEVKQPLRRPRTEAEADHQRRTTLAGKAGQPPRTEARASAGAAAGSMSGAPRTGEGMGGGAVAAGGAVTAGQARRAITGENWRSDPENVNGAANTKAQTWGSPENEVLQRRRLVLVRFKEMVPVAACRFRGAAGLKLKDLWWEFIINPKHERHAKIMTNRDACDGEFHVPMSWDVVKHHYTNLKGRRHEDLATKIITRKYGTADWQLAELSGSR